MLYGVTAWAKSNTARPGGAFHDYRPSTCANAASVAGSQKVISII
jgi:hypothetical protein